MLSIAYADGDDNVIKAEGVVPTGTEEELIPIINKKLPSLVTFNNCNNAYTIALKITTNEFTTGALRYTFESSNDGEME